MILTNKKFLFSISLQKTLPLAFAVCLTSSFAAASLTHSLASEEFQSDFWSQHGFNSYYRYDQELAEDLDFSLLNGLLFGEEKFVVDFAFLNPVWMVDEDEFGVDLNWNRAGKPVLNLGYDQRNPDPDGMPSVMLLWDKDIEIVRNLNLVMKGNAPEAELVRITGGEFIISSDFSASLYSDDSEPAIINLAKGSLAVSESGRAELNGYFTEGGIGIKAGYLTRVENRGKLAVTLDSNDGMGTGISLGSSAELLNQPEAILSVSAGIGINLGSASQFTNLGTAEILSGTIGIRGAAHSKIENQGTLAIQSSGKGLELQKGAQFNNSGTAGIIASQVGIELGNGASADNSGSLEVRSEKTGIFLASGAGMTSAGSLYIEAENVFEGEGEVLVKGGSVVLSGSLDNFKGTYHQEGGVLDLTNSTSLNKGMSFENAALIASSGQIFNISSGSWESGSGLLDVLFNTEAFDAQNAFSRVVLTDGSVDISYLAAAGRLLSSATLIVKGEIGDHSSKTTYLTMEDYRNLKANEKTSNLVLANGVLELAADFTNEKIAIGSLKGGDSLGKLVLGKEADVELYSAGNPLFMNTSGVRLEDGASLLISSLAHADEDKALSVEVSVEVENGAGLTLEGNIYFSSASSVANSGVTKVLGGSSVSLTGQFIQSAGLLNIEAGSILEGAFIELNGGELKADGNLLVSDTLKIRGDASAAFSATAAIKNLALGSAASGVVRIESGADVSVDTASGSGDFVLLGAGKTTVLQIKDHSNLADAGFNVGSNSLLILGNTGHLDFNSEAAFDIIGQIGSLEGKAGVFLNCSVDLSKNLQIAAGSISAKTASSVVLGADSVLLVHPSLEEGAFISSDGSVQTVKVENGAQIYVIDPFKTVVLSDENVEFEGEFSKDNIKTANSSIVLSMKKEDGRWVVSKEIAESAASSFLYPNIQHAVLEKGEGLESGNAGEEFFLRADNALYMTPDLRDRMIGEATQLAGLLAFRRNAFDWNGKLLRALQAQTVEMKDLAPGSVKPYVSLLGGVADFKKHGDFLGNAGSRTTTSGLQIGASGTTGNYEWAGGFSYVKNDVESRHAVLEADSDQYSVNAGFAVGKSFENLNYGLSFSFGHTQADMSASLPFSMDMGKAKAKAKEWYFSFGAPLAYSFGNVSEISFAPTVWYFRGNSIDTAIGGKDAFHQKNKKAVIGELPLTASIKGEWGSNDSVMAGLRGYAGGAIRAGDLSRKGTLKIAGYSEKDSFSQKEFSRWSTQIGLELKLKKNDFESFVNIEARKTRFGIEGNASANIAWRF